MLPLITWILIFAIALFFLIKSADYFTSSAKKIGLYLGMPTFLVGATIVALGTSIPELATSVFSIFKGAPEIVIGDVVGSNITNILLILGLAALIFKKVEFKGNLKFGRVEIPFLMFGTVFFFFFSLNGLVSFFEAAILLLIYIMFIFLTVKNREKNNKEKVKWDWKNFFVLIISCILIYFSAEYVVRSIIEISTKINIPKEVIAATVVGLGTSLPELSVSLIAIKKKDYEMSIGNIVGSNLFNTLVVIGIPGMIKALPATGVMISFSIPLMLISTMLLFYLFAVRRINRWHGVTFLITYFYFILMMFGVV